MAQVQGGQYLLMPYCYPVEKKRRFGAHKDGGYVTIEPQTTGEGEAECPWDLYLSVGIGEEESFTKAFIEHYKLEKDQCWAFDGTIKSYPKQYKPPNGLWFVNKNVGPAMTHSTVNLNKLIETHDHIFLKMDIEGAEYEWLYSLCAWQLERFKQIVIEFHDIFTHPLAEIIFNKMLETHIPVHLHGNNHGPRFIKDGELLPTVVEVTYIRRSDNSYEALNSDSPKENIILGLANLDYPNNPYTNELVFSFCESAVLP